MTNEQEVAQAWQTLYDFIARKQMFPDEPTPESEALNTLKKAALKPVGLAGTDITAIKEAETPYFLDGHIIVSLAGGKIDIQVYKLHPEHVATALREAAEKFNY